MKVRLDLSSTQNDFPEIVGWYFRNHNAWLGPFDTIDQAKKHHGCNVTEEVRTFIFVNITNGFSEM